ncbi:MAG: oligosaccharide flippase family protein [Pseudomonadota bacterium]
MGSIKAHLTSDKLIGRTMKSAATVSAAQLFSNALRLLSNLVLVRLVAPEAFGLMAIAMTINQAAVMFADIGISQSVIRSERGREPAFIGTAFISNVVLFFSLCLIVTAISLIMAATRESFPTDSIYSSVQAAPLIAFASLQLAVQGMISPKVWIARRELSLWRPTLIDTGAQLIGVICTLTLAWAGLGVWSLAIGSLVTISVGTALGHVLLTGPQVPLVWERSSFNEILQFGKWLIPASIAGFLINRGDRLLVGLWLGATQFSIYVIAALWFEVVNSIVQRANASVSLSSLSEALRTSKEFASQFYQKARLISDAVCLCSFLGFNLIIQPLTDLLYPDVYAPAVGFARLLSVGLLALPLQLTHWVVLSSGDSRSFAFVLWGSSAALFASAVVLEDQLGVQAAILAFAMRPLFIAPVSLMVASKVININPLTELRTVFMVFIGTAAVLIAN